MQHCSARDKPLVDLMLWKGAGHVFGSNRGSEANLAQGTLLIAIEVVTQDLYISRSEGQLFTRV
jgi:hypothetical protein